MNITKNNKYLPEQSKQHQNISLLISSDLEPSALSKLLSSNSQLINKVDNKSNTFLSYALQRKKFDLCTLILSIPDLDLSFRNKNNDTYLHIATEAQCYTIVKELLDRGLDINQQNSQGNTPLHLAIMNNDDLIKQLLINKGADGSIRNNSNMTPEMLSEVAKDPFEEDNIHLGRDPKNKVILFNTSEEKNKSLKIDWSDGNINPRLYISSIQANEEDYAKSFINQHHHVVSSTETRYNSGEGINVNNNDKDKEHVINGFATDRLNYENNEEADEDLFDLTNSDEEKKEEDDVDNKDNKDNNKGDDNDNADADTIKDADRNSIKNDNEAEEEDLVNTRYSANILKNSTKDNTTTNNEQLISVHFEDIKPIVPTKAKREDYKESHQSFFVNKTINNSTSSYYNKVSIQQDKNLIETNQDKIPIEIENNFIFSAPNIDLQNHTSPPTASKPQETSALPAQTSPNQSKSTELHSFLASIKMEQYTSNLIASGFDDLKLLVDQTKIGLGITDSNLREAGIEKSGERAKILIKLQEISGNFRFDIPKGVYHKCDDLINCSNDPYIIKLSKWLTALKIEGYLNNFISNGYHSLDLLQMQMESKQPLTNEVLLDEIHIDKLGYCTRVLNKLKEEGHILANQLKLSAVVIEKKSKEEICECRVF